VRQPGLFYALEMAAISPLHRIYRYARIQKYLNTAHVSPHARRFPSAFAEFYAAACEFSGMSDSVGPSPYNAPQRFAID
jgi:hypothetical protein